PQDVASAVLYLVSEDARTVTGTILKVDAGYTLG
ncbi:MAG: SDR family oxidoreductase, partial [Anaerolineae bacterium]